MPRPDPEARTARPVVSTEMVGSTGARAKPPAGAEAGLEPERLVATRYRVKALLGAGGMGAVYRAIDEKLHREVALKVMRPELVAEPQMAARFEREAFASTRITSPHVVVVHDFGRDGDLLFLVMELLSGMSLSDRIAAGPLPPDDAFRIAAHIARALETAHGAGVVHRDLKPDNVFLTSAGPAKVLDFGIARMLDGGPVAASAQHLTVSGMIVGTPLYMSPEMARQQAVGPGADLYALGAILYEMLTGSPPFDAAETILLLSKHMMEAPPRLTDHALASGPAEDAFAALSPHVERLLSKEADARGTAAEIRATLEGLAGASSGWGMERKTSRSGEQPAVDGRIDPVGSTLASGDVPGRRASSSTPRTSTPPLGAAAAGTPSAGTQSAGTEAASTQTSSSRSLALGAAAVVTLAVLGAAFWSATGSGEAETAPPVAGVVPTAIESAVIAAPTPAPVATPEPPHAVEPPLGVEPPPVVAETVTVRFVVRPATARLLSSEGTVEGTSLRLPRDGVEHSVRIEAPGYEARVETVTADADREIAVSLRELRGARPAAERPSTAAPAPAAPAPEPEPEASNPGLHREF